MSDIVRVLRVIEYVGDRYEVEKQLLNSLQDGTKIIEKTGVKINVATVGQFPEILKKGE